MQGFEIRALCKEDIPSMAILWGSLLIPSWTEDMIKESFNLSITLGYGAFLEKSSCLLGFIIGSLVQEEVEIYGIAVREDYQGKKIGRRLLKKFEQTCFIHNGKVIFLEVAQSNKKGQSFYLSQGYSFTGKRTNYYPHREEALVFCKKETE